MEVYGQTGYVITVRHDDVEFGSKGKTKNDCGQAGSASVRRFPFIVQGGEFWRERRPTRLLLWKRTLLLPRFSTPHGVQRLQEIIVSSGSGTGPHTESATIPYA